MKLPKLTIPTTGIHLLLLAVLSGGTILHCLAQLEKMLVYDLVGAVLIILGIVIAALFPTRIHSVLASLAVLVPIMLFSEPTVMELGLVVEITLLILMAGILGTYLHTGNFLLVFNFFPGMKVSMWIFSHLSGIKKGVKKFLKVIGCLLLFLAIAIGAWIFLAEMLMKISNAFGGGSVLLSYPGLVISVVFSFLISAFCIKLILRRIK